jgi:hypothetical protein
MRVKIAIPKVIDCAASAAHNESAAIKESTRSYDCEGCRDGISEWRGEEGAEEAGKEEVGRSGRLIQANEFGIGNPRAREARQNASFRYFVV